METPCHIPQLREEEAGHWCLCHNDRRIICGKEARVSFLSKEALGVGSVYWGECTTQTICFQSLDIWSFLSGISALFVWNSLVLIFPACANKAWSCPICCLLKGEHVCRDFQEMESPCTKPGLQDKEGTHWILCHNYSRSLAVKKAKVDFLSEVTLGLVWAHGLDDIVEKGSLQTILVVFLKWLYCPFLTTSYVFLIPDMEKKVFSGQIRLLLKGDQVWNVFHWMETQSMESVIRDRGTTLVNLLQCVGEFWGGGRQGLFSWA